MEYKIGIIFDDKTEPSTVQIPASSLCAVTDRHVTIRTEGEFKGNAFFLSSGYDWVIVRDHLGSLCLVPMKQKVLA